MRLASRQNFISCSAVAVMLAACSPSDPIVGKSENKGQRVSPSSATKLAATPIAKARYKLEVFKHYDIPESRLSLCNGEVAMTVWSDMGGLAPQGVIDCVAFGKIDLSELMAKDDEAIDIDPALMRNYKGFGKVMRIPNPSTGEYTFSPPIPMVIGPVIQDHSEFEGFTMTDTLTINTVDPQFGSITDQGTIFYEVFETKTSFTPENTSLVFDNVIHYERRVNGFDRTPDRGAKLLFSSMEFWFNTQPIAIPQIILRAMPSQMGQFAGGMAKAGDAMLGRLTFKLTLISHTQL